MSVRSITLKLCKYNHTTSHGFKTPPHPAAISLRGPSCCSINLTLATPASTRTHHARTHVHAAWAAQGESACNNNSNSRDSSSSSPSVRCQRLLCACLEACMVKRRRSESLHGVDVRLKEGRADFFNC